MKSFKLLATSALLLGSIALAAPGFAGGGEKGEWKHHGGGYGGKHIERVLDLTDAQKETLKAQRQGDREANKNLHAKIFEAHDALRAAVESGANDAELAALAENLGKLHAEQALAGVKAHKAFVAVLTDEQKQKLAELKAKREERRKSREERWQDTKAVSSR